MKLLGHCAVCEAEVFDIAQTHEGTGDPRVDGTPRRLGDPRRDAWRVTLVTASGRLMQVTTCRICRDMDPKRVVKLWHEVARQQGLALDDTYRVARGGEPVTERQRDGLEASLRAFAVNPPLGILSAQPWQEVLRERTRIAG